MQVFDKALTEPTFCEIYATLCHDLNKQLPQFDPEPEAEDRKKITFRRCDGCPSQHRSQCFFGTRHSTCFLHTPNRLWRGTVD